MTIDPTNPAVATGTTDASLSSTGLGDRGGVRGDAYTVQAVVTVGDDPAVGVTVTFAAPDTVSEAATTGDDGVASITLPTGDYTVSASSDAGSASATITVVPSTDPLIVGLSLTPDAA